MEFTLDGALRKYRRMRAWRSFALVAITFTGALAPAVLEFGRTDSLICWIGAAIVGLLGHLELRLKTIQVRLASMDDRLTNLSGAEDNGNLVLELNDW